MICSANQWNGFYMVTAPVMKELKLRRLCENAYFPILFIYNKNNIGNVCQGCSQDFSAQTVKCLGM